MVLLAFLKLFSIFKKQIVKLIFLKNLAITLCLTSTKKNLKITDRKKDIIVSAGGDNISPAKIENRLSNSPAIDQCLVYGEGKNYLVALIVPSKELKEQKEKIKEIINEINKNLTLVEKIKKFHLINENFSIENGLLTPTMKVKRNKVIKKYKDNFEKLYKS